MSGRCYPVAKKPEIIKEPVLVGDNDIDGKGAVIYGTVIKDSGRYRMWYQARPKAHAGGNVHLVGYAESG